MPEQVNDIVNQIWAFLSQLDQAYLVMIVNGLIAGWLAGQILGGGGLIRNVIVGIIGAFVGGALVRNGLLTLPPEVTSITEQIPYGYGTQIVISTIGAFLVVLVARFLGGRSTA
jgi:uncharacterized membrane protein YeaQ/YmgE (transglycosylase-associated protein family)